MNITVSRESLHAALSVAAGLCNRKSPMPILANVLLRADGKGRLTVAASDLSMSISTEIECDAKGKFVAALPGVKLAEIAGALRGETISISVADHNAEVKSGKSKFNLPGLNPADFPALAWFGGEFSDFDGATLLDLVGKTAYAAQSDPNRPNMAGVHLVCLDDKVRIEATDGHRLCRVERQGKIAATGIVIPKTALADIGKILKGATKIGIAADHGSLYLRAGATLASVRLIDTQFPNVDQVIPKTCEHNAVAPRSELLEAVRRASIVSEKSALHDAIDLEFGDGELKLIAQSTALGRGEETMAVDHGGKDFVVRVSSKYLVEALESIDGDEVQIGFPNAEHNGMIILKPMGYSHIAIIMTMDRR